MPREYARREILIKLMEFPCSALLLSVCGLQRWKLLPRVPTRRPRSPATEWASRSTSASVAAAVSRHAKRRTTSPRSRSTFGPGWRDMSSTMTVESTSTAPRAASRVSPAGGRSQTSCARSSFPSSATNATTRPASRSARSAPPSRPRTASILVDRTTASAAATASRPAPTARAIWTRAPRPPTSAPSAITGSRRAAAGLRRGLPDQARVFGELTSRPVPLRRMMRMSQLQVLKPSLNTEPKVFYSELDGEVR